ncbi:amyloid-beta A4 precursor protein-binding family A member 1-like isoform X1 [Solea senegalensis]|uniref:Amyloid-beta A4 protein-binding family A member 1-like isoform X1 n=1 Tax=Solea senegalensis TaxID=28829 RepID=A0AAV6R0D5_SOLSE|nr:amyloid-beta A4 precursor protein-binding family A member 1-like isoform X1 [Solea senegalensis]
MSHKHQGEMMEELSEERKVPARTRQHNGPKHGEAPVRRSWRPCQMVNQDGELNPHHHHHDHHPPHHHHHPSTGRGSARQRRRPTSGQSQAQSPGLASSRPDGDQVWGADPHPVPLPRPAVTRYRRHGDPNPRLKGHRQRQPIREMQDASHGVEERGGAVQQNSADSPETDQSEDRVTPHHTPVAVVTPTQLSPGPARHNVQPGPQKAPTEAEAELQEEKVEAEADLLEEKIGCEEDELEDVQKNDEEPEQREDGEDCCSNTGDSSSCQDVVQTVEGGAKECDENVEEDQEEVLDDAAEDVVAQGSELNDLCSDTESAASLSLDGPLHSPPPLHSPTPPSSPDVLHFPQLDHFSEDMSMSPIPDNDLPEDEDRSESCSPSHSTSCSESYPKTYADFYSESHQKSYPEPAYKSYSETKSHPTSFPEPLKKSYSELHREPLHQTHRRSERYEESCREPFTNHREENLKRLSPSFSAEESHHALRQVRDRGPHHSPPDRSVGCRLHHYDGESDSEGNGGGDRSPALRSRRCAPARGEPQEKSPTSGQGSSGDAISLAIKDIKEAIEEVKTKTVRSPYTPDRPEEPIWVMRQELGPTEETTADHSPSPSESESPSCFASAPVRETVSPQRPESSGHHPQKYQQPQSQHNQHHHQHHHHQRDTVRPSQTHTHTPPPPPPPPGQQQQQQEIRRSLPPFPTFVDVLGPCDPDDLLDGIIFAATYLGCTHLLSERTPTKSARMQQAQEAMSRVRTAQKQAKNRKKSPDAETLSTAEVDLFMSTQRIKVLNADTQESLMDLPLRTISYIADIGNMVVLMSRGKMVRSHSAQENLDDADERSGVSHDDRRLYRMICHVFESEDAQLIAQSIGQSFSVAYQEFLRANGIDPEDLSQREYSDLLNTQDMYNDDLIHFSKSENCRDVYIEKQKGEMVGVVIVESGWGSILPTVIIASMMHAGPAEKSGRLNIGDQIMTVNGMSLVGLPLSTCQSIIKGLKSQSRIKMNIVRCPPVTMVLIRRPDLRYQLGFSVQNGIICSLMRGGIAERGGVRVGHRIIEINGQSVVATPHEKIVQILSNAMGEIHMKTMPAAMYRLLTAQEQPVYI